MFTWPAIIVITTVIFIHTALAQVLGKMPTRSSTITPFKLPCPPYAPESFVPLELAFFYRNPLHSYGPPASHVPDPWRLMHLRRICLQISELASELAMREYVPVSLPHPQVNTATYEPPAFVPQQASKEQIEKMRIAESKSSTPGEHGYEPQAFVPQQASKEQIEKTDKTDK